MHIKNIQKITGMLLIFVFLSGSSCRLSTDTSILPELNLMRIILNGGLKNNSRIVSSIPADNSYITEDQIIRIQFDISIDTAKPFVFDSGSCPGTSSAVWSTTAYPEDTVTITPDSIWTSGDCIFNLNYTDMDGNSISDLIAFMIAEKTAGIDPEGTVYAVSFSGNDANSGKLWTEEIATIQHAVSLANNDGPGAGIIIVEGDNPFFSSEYSINSSNAGEAIGLSSGIYLLGGYNLTDASLPSNYTSRIIDGCTTTCAAVSASDNTSTAANTKFRGFTIYAGAGSTASAAISVSNGASPAIEGNIIRGGSAAGSRGISVAGASSPLIINNVIKAGTGANFTGIYTSAGSSKIYNNTIDGGSVSSAGISTGAADEIKNNMIFGADFCIYENSTPDPASLFNNNLYNCSTALYHDNDTSADYSAICSGNPGNSGCTVTLSTPAGSGNVSVNMDSFFDNPSVNPLNMDSLSIYSTPAPPCSVTEGGVDLSAFATFDILRTARTAPFTLGAYEFGGTCN